MMLSESKVNRLIASIYDAAVDERLLSDALKTLVEVTHTQTASLEVYAPRSARFMAGRNPLISAEHAQSYLGHWRHHLPQRRSTDRWAVAQVLRSSDIWDREVVLNSAFFNDWLRPQGMGGDGLYANVAMNGRATAVLGAFKSFKAPEFTKTDERLFAIAAKHFCRAIEIHHRLQMAELQQVTMPSGSPPSGFAVVADDGRVLASDESTHRRLCTAGLLTTVSDSGTVVTLGSKLKHVIAGIGRTDAVRSSGRFLVQDRLGVTLEVTIIPLSQSAAPHDPWRAIDRPAALLHVRAPQEDVKARVDQVAEKYELTSAEARVVLAVVNGHGRAAAAALLGIRETTVRSHLSAIFSKMDIHRQTELTKIVLSAW